MRTPGDRANSLLGWLLEAWSTVEVNCRLLPVRNAVLPGVLQQAPSVVVFAIGLADTYLEPHCSLLQTELPSTQSLFFPPLSQLSVSAHSLNFPLLYPYRYFPQWISYMQHISSWCLLLRGIQINIREYSGISLWEEKPGRGRNSVRTCFSWGIIFPGFSPKSPVNKQWVVCPQAILTPSDLEFYFPRLLPFTGEYKL